jgi:hypothetical protein
LFTTTLVKRIADGFISLYSNDDLKKYEGTSPLFANIPKEVARVLLHSFQDLLESDITTITKNDLFTVPNSIELFVTDPLTIDPMPVLQDVTDEFEPEQDKNLYPPDELTPPLQSDNPKINSQEDIKLNPKPEVPKPPSNPDLGPDPDEQNLLLQLDRARNTDLNEDLLELDKLGKKDHKVNTSLDSDESDTEDMDLDIPNLETGINLRSGRKVRFQ